MSIHEKLMTIQNGLKAPKSQYNSFGKYSYRNCEDILESLKPLLKQTGTVVTLSDELVTVGGRFYVKATATLIDILDGSNIAVTSYAREEESKKGMDGSQVTGASSSYARKYALNGLFAIDDTKYSDTTNTGESRKSSANNIETKIYCERCGNALKPYTGKNGKNIGISEHAEISRKQFGKVTCIDCIREEKQRREEAEAMMAYYHDDAGDRQ